MKRIEKIILGNPLDAATTMGPMTIPESVDSLSKMVSQFYIS